MHGVAIASTRAVAITRVLRSRSNIPIAQRRQRKPIVQPVDPRNLQANERTLLAWIRTGLALMAFGFVIDRMALWFRYELRQDESLSLVLGTVAIVLGIVCQLIGAVRFVAMRRALVGGGSLVQGIAGPVAMVVLVAILGAALLIFLLVA